VCTGWPKLKYPYSKFAKSWQSFRILLQYKIYSIDREVNNYPMLQGSVTECRMAEYRMVKMTYYGPNAERHWALCRMGGVLNGRNAECRKINPIKRMLCDVRNFTRHFRSNNVVIYKLVMCSAQIRHFPDLAFSSNLIFLVRHFQVLQMQLPWRQV